MSNFFSGKFLSIFMLLVFVQSISMACQVVDKSSSNIIGDNQIQQHDCIQSDAKKVIVSDGYIRQMPPGQTVTAMFMTLENTTDKVCRLVGASVSIAKRVELHSHFHENGVMSMRPVDGIDLPVEKKVAFEPGGNHLMLYGLDHELTKKEQHDVTLIFDECPDVMYKTSVEGVLHHLNHH
tara:strand:+ start:180 stop:719 length:540 start_codon:yes stop_codon:yes gene_type:complete